jgi:hypothetical protein
VDVSPNEPNAAAVPAAEAEDPREEPATEASPVSPNEANPRRVAVSPNEANRRRPAVSPNEANRVPSSWIDGPDGSDSAWFGLPAWPGAIPSGAYPGPEGVLI